MCTLLSPPPKYFTFIVNSVFRHTSVVTQFLNHVLVLLALNTFYSSAVQLFISVSWSIITSEFLIDFLSSSNLFPGKSSCGSPPLITALGFLKHRAVSSMPESLFCFVLFCFSGRVNHLTWFSGVPVLLCLAQGFSISRCQDLDLTDLGQLGLWWSCCFCPLPPAASTTANIGRILTVLECAQCVCWRAGTRIWLSRVKDRTAKAISAVQAPWDPALVPLCLCRWRVMIVPRTQGSVGLNEMLFISQAALRVDSSQQVSAPRIGL